VLHKHAEPFLEVSELLEGSQAPEHGPNCIERNGNVMRHMVVCKNPVKLVQPKFGEFGPRTTSKVKTDT
jgi:hypothetical protein